MKFERVKGNIPVFSGEYDGRDRTIFGGTEQSNDINQQFTPEFIKGWGIVGKNEFPTLQDFNALGFTHSALIGYLYQSGVAQWVAGADYYTGSVAVQGVDLYVAIQDNPTLQPSSLQGWRLVSPALLHDLGQSTSAPVTQKATTDAINKKWDIQQTIGSGNIVRASMIEVPVDQIFIFDGAAPAGFVERKGQVIDEATMPKLYARYGTNMPDDRDRVHRMTGTLAGSAGTTQEDAMQRITGSAGGAFNTKITGAFKVLGSVNQSGQGSGDTWSSVDFDSSRSARTSTETRVKSRIVIFCNKIQ